MIATSTTPVAQVGLPPEGFLIGIGLLVLAGVAVLVALGRGEDSPEPGDDDEDSGPIAPEPPPAGELFVDLPGGVTLDPPEQEALAAAYDHLTVGAADASPPEDGPPAMRVARERVPAELVEAVYPDHPADHEDPRRWYANRVGPALAVLTPLDPPLDPWGDHASDPDGNDGNEGDREDRDRPPRDGVDDGEPTPAPSGHSRDDVSTVGGSDADASRVGRRGGREELAPGAAERAERFDHEVVQRWEGEMHVVVEEEAHAAGFLVDDSDGRPTIRVLPGDGTRADLDWLASAREYLWERAIAGELYPDPERAPEQVSGSDPGTGRERGERNT